MCLMLVLYLTIITAANVVTAMFAPITLFNGVLIIPAGSLFVGVTFVLRDLVQMEYGKRDTYLVILVASGMSAVLSAIAGDTVLVATASVIAFLVSESLDTELFTRIKKSFLVRVVLSGTIGGTVDSALFVILGISPLGAGMLTWEQVPFAIMGQTLAKMLMQPMGAFIFKRRLTNHDGSRKTGVLGL